MKPHAFSGRHVDTYAEGPPRQVPGFEGPHRMTAMLLAERMPSNGRVLVLGAGGGLELDAFAQAHPGWSPQSEPERSLWIARHVAFGAAEDDRAQLENARQAIATRLTILAPEEEEAMLREAGFSNVSLFYAGFSFKGWVSYAA
jgi:hypothetical protein